MACVRLSMSRALTTVDRVAEEVEPQPHVTGAEDPAQQVPAAGCCDDSSGCRRAASERRRGLPLPSRARRLPSCPRRAPINASGAAAEAAPLGDVEAPQHHAHRAHPDRYGDDEVRRSQVDEEQAKAKKREDDLRQNIERDVNDNAGSCARGAHPLPGDQLGAHDVTADLRHREEAVDRLCDPPCPRHRGQPDPVSCQ